jgi:hypothetical protein
MQAAYDATLQKIRPLSLNQFYQIILVFPQTVKLFSSLLLLPWRAFLLL